MEDVAAMSESHFSALDWKPGKRRGSYVRERRCGGQKQAPPAFIAAGKLSGIGSGKHRICSALTRAGVPCRDIAMKGCDHCRAHGGASQTARLIRPYVRKDGVVTVPRNAPADNP
jgi:hypothetical protein